ncbi:hypothetical protein AAFF_G00159590 [Aldrovandia affinis]|uniref:Uncharacterized protein n=1 Tax=Aldrovandia affinis TaxID=143900 RepID=A0AAD7R2S1_9TELE|nr:hypothetical protein AAFF_G00159590 [Aldrovandia affinis]
MKAAKYLAVLIDGDTDISNTECKIVYVALVEDGKPVNLLVGKQTLEHSMPLRRMERHWMKKCISFGADGASVNMGHRGE